MLKKILQLEWMFFDVDGILTDGSLVYEAGGDIKNLMFWMDTVKNLIQWCFCGAN